MDNEKIKFDERVSEILRKIGIPSKLSGFHYIIDCVYHIVEEDDRIDKMYMIYSLVAKDFQTNDRCVESAIRHAVDIIYFKRRVRLVNKFFGYKIFSDLGRPTSNQVLMLVANKLSEEFYFDDDGTLKSIT